jgi:hypothetical protein
MGPWFIVTETFDPRRGEAWHRYVAWSKLTQLTEVVSLDSNLCPPVVGEIRDEDWPHIVNEDFMTNYFTDLEYLLRRCGDVADRNLLCVFRNPEAHPTPPAGPHGFRFEGCDLVDIQGGISALTNCGGFPLAFSSDELSSHGLLPSLERGREVQRALRERYPLDHHANCHVWSLFRATQPAAAADAAQTRGG